VWSDNSRTGPTRTAAPDPPLATDTDPPAPIDASMTAARNAEQPSGTRRRPTLVLGRRAREERAKSSTTASCPKAEDLAAPARADRGEAHPRFGCAAPASVPEAIVTVTSSAGSLSS
jgi:hypothetical protein